jgi:sugar phosphate isomerase/epimerase
MNISIASYAFHGLLEQGRIDLFGYLESCRYRYHLDTADIWNGMIPNLEAEFLKKVRDGLEERGLTLVNLCVDGPHIWEDDPDVRDQHHQNALEYLQAANFLGARTIRIDAGGRGEQFTEEQFDWIVKRYREYAQVAYDHGFRVGPENHWGPEVQPENMARICQAVDHPGFGVLLHLRGNAGDAVIAPWAMHTHISYEIVQNCLEASVAMLQEKGYTGAWSVEHHSGKNEYAEVAVQVARVRAVLHAVLQPVLTQESQ